MLSQEEIAELQKENERLKQENLVLKSNGAVGLYYELNRLINETINYTRSITISGLLSSDEKGDKRFERTMALIKAAKENVLDLEEIKTKLNLTGNEKKDKDEKPFIEQVAVQRN